MVPAQDPGSGTIEGSTRCRKSESSKAAAGEGNTRAAASRESGLNHLREAVAQAQGPGVVWHLCRLVGEIETRGSCLGEDRRDLLAGKHLFQRSRKIDQRRRCG